MSSRYKIDNFKVKTISNVSSSKAITLNLIIKSDSFSEKKSFRN